MSKPEKQNIEFKSSWHDDYLKWICGFANALGGKIFIGLNDTGEVVGVGNYKELMESIPNKIHDFLGILAEVNLDHISSRLLCRLIPYQFH
jgi:ATP-dependent DNA helicase RecG